MSLPLKKNSQRQLTERLFFHDIINLTHGLLLFLSNKKSGKRGIESHEIPALEKEIKTLQMMLKDHYQMKHKNLDENSEYISLKDALPAVKGLMETYLGQKQIPYTLNIRNEDEPLLVSLTAFYRILNNLIKNMSEAGATHAQIDLIVEKKVLLIETKNTISKTIKSDQNARSLEGLGLESIRLLALESGGHFGHEIVNQLWCNHVALPLKETEDQTKNWSAKKVA